MAKPWRPKRASFEGGSNNSCRIWNIESKKENDRTYYRLIDGLLNNLTAANINEWVEVQENGFLILTVNSSGGSISSFDFEFSNTMPEAIVDSENIPPTTFQIFFAKVNNFKALSRFNKALTVLPVESRQQGVIPTQAGQRNFKNFYTWKIDGA
jgi:hypothetical protein